MKVKKQQKDVKQALLKKYLNTCQDSLSYVGGEGQIEDSLWDEIKRLSKEMKREGIVYPDYETIECVKEDWA